MKRAKAIFHCMLLGVLACTCEISYAAVPLLKETFPRLMGMNISAKNYQDPRYQDEISRLDIVILGFYQGWSARTHRSVLDTVRDIKKRNPHILVGQYTLVDEAYDDLGETTIERDKYLKLQRENWWLRNAAGRRVQWTDQYNSWMVNFTEWSKPDSNGRRYPQWLAERDYRMYFKPVTDFDIWYVDDVNYRPRVVADWKLDGKDDDINNPVIQSAYRKGQRAYWEAARSYAPTRLLLGNTDNDLSYPEFVNFLNGAFLEGLMGLDWSIETWGGWHKAMERYWAVTKNTAPPHLVGFNVWGDPQDYRFFRYAFASCLMGDGYFSFTDKSKNYSGVPWFDEYSIDLGKAIDPPQHAAWYGGVYKRAFEKGVAIVNPTSRSVEIDLGEQLYRIAGMQDKQVNDGKRVSRLTLQPKDGIILSRYPVSPRIYEPPANDLRKTVR